VMIKDVYYIDNQPPQNPILNIGSSLT
jgi:hypothetical protein